MTNSTRPLAIRALTLRPLASLNVSAMFAAIVLGLVLLMRLSVTTPEADSTIATAMVSPSARPRPSIAADTMPERAYGKTAMRVISQRVAPRASAASSCSRGVCRKISRQMAVMIGRIITASTIPAVKIVRPVADGGPAKNGRNPRLAFSHS